jgi:hypothetical protein
MAFEHKRFLTAMEEASEVIIQGSLNPDTEEEDTFHGDHTDKSRSIHTITKIMSSMFWEDYLVGGLGEMLVLHKVNSHHDLIHREPKCRSQFETYTASLRVLLTNSNKSYIMKILFPSYALEELQLRINMVILRFNEVLKYSESTTSMLEEYLTWIEHGSDLAAAYMNALRPDIYIDEDGNEEETEEVEPEELYNDIRVKAYALLKLSDCNPAKMAACLESIDNLMFSLNEMVDLAHQLYASLDPKAFENIFNAMVSKRNRAPNYKGTRFENVHELNEYVRQRIKESVEEPHGFMYNVSELLEESRVSYIDRLATEIIETLSFLPSKKEQKRYVGQFESGRIWQNVNLGE